ncbi:ABC transporter permease [Streptomyces sp. MAD19A]|uniref:ABC transporter permease n=1 Tax=Streptomyces sp. MAD19A TaxID=3242896 RepID=UPI003528984D
MTASMPTAAPSRPVRASGGSLPGAVAAEWIKLWSVRSTWWCLLGGLLLTGLTAPIIGATMSNNSPAGQAVPVTEIAVSTVYVTQFAVIALAMLVVTVEYSSGSIRTALQAVPNRGHLLAAKTLVVSSVSLVVGFVLGLIGIGVVSVTLSSEVESGGMAELFGCALRIGVYLAMTSVITVAVSVAVRSAAGALSLVFVGLSVLPIILQASDIDPLVFVADRMPNTAGTVFMNGDTSPYGAGAGLLFLLLWAAATQCGGYMVLRKRDA